jgi:hypothetical protein
VSVGEYVEKVELSYMAGESVKGISTMKNNLAILQITKHEITRLSNSLPGCMPKEIKKQARRDL